MFTWLKKALNVAFNTVNVGWYARNGYPRLYSLLGGGMPAWSGESVSLETALSHSVVWACTRLVSENVAAMPLQLMQEARSGDKRPAKTHSLYRILHDEPNEQMSDMEWRETLQAHLLLEGNAYSLIERQSGGDRKILALRPLLPCNVRPDQDKSGRLVYVVRDANAAEKAYTVEIGKPHDIFHVRGLGHDGLCGYPVLALAKNSIGTALSAERYAAAFYATGGRVPFILEMPPGQRFKTDQEADAFNERFDRQFATPDSFHKKVVLENGMTYKQIGLSPEQSQFIETRQFIISEICRRFLVSPHLVGDLSRATFSNIEQLSLEFVKFTLHAWVKRWEKAISRCLLSPGEKNDGYYVKHNLNALLRGDFKTRMEGYSVMLQNGIASVNEARAFEDLNPIDGGDDHHIQLNMQTLPGGTPTTSERAQLIKIGTSTRGGSNAD